MCVCVCVTVMYINTRQRNCSKVQTDPQKHLDKKNLKNVWYLPTFCLCLYFSVFVCLSVFVRLPVSPSLSLFFSLCLCLSVCPTLSVAPPPPPLSHTLSELYHQSLKTFQSIISPPSGLVLAEAVNQLNQSRPIFTGVVYMTSRDIVPRRRTSVSKFLDFNVLSTA